MARTNSIDFHKGEKNGTNLNVLLNDSYDPKDKNIYFDDPYLHNVERIVSRRTRKRKVEYLIKWKGYSEADNTWEKEANVTKDLAIAFEKERKSIAARKAKQRKLEREVPSVESNGTFEVPEESTSKDATQEKLHVEEKIQSTENLCHNDRLKVLTQVPSEMLMDTSSEFEKLEFSTSSEELSLFQSIVPEESTSKDTTQEKLHVEEKIQSTENLCHNDRLKVLTQVPSEMLMDTSSEFEKLEFSTSSEELSLFQSIVPEESTSKDATQEKLHVEEKIQSTENLCHNDRLKVLTQVPSEMLMDTSSEFEKLEFSTSSEELLLFQSTFLPSKELLYDVSEDTFNAVPMQVLHGEELNFPYMAQNEWLEKASTEVQNQSMDLCDEVPTDALNATLAQLLNDIYEGEQNFGPTEPEEQRVQAQAFDEISNDVLNASVMQVQGQVCWEIPNDELTEAPPTPVLMEVSENKQNEWLNRIPSKEPGYVKIHSLRKKSSRSKILVQQFSTTPAQVLKTSTKKSSTITYEMSPEQPGSVNMQSLEKELPRLRNSNRKVPTVAAKVLNTSTSKTSTITLVDVCMQSAYISEEENERDLLGYDGFKPVYA